MPTGNSGCLNSSRFCLPVLAGAIIGATVQPPAAQAQTELETIYVEGVGLGSEEVPAGSTGSAVSVVTGEELEERQIRNAGEALRSLPGVSVNRTGSLGGLTQVRLRGAQANHTLVLIDGIEANDTGNGALDFSDLDANNIERIEVIRGPQSGLYGSKALGGVINIITESRRGPLQVKSRVEGGSFGTTNAWTGISGGNDFAFGSLGLSSQQTNGFNIAPSGDETDETELRSLSFKGGIRPFEPLSLDVVLRSSDKLAGSDAEGPGGGPNGQLPLLFDTEDFNTADVLLAGAGAKLETFGGRWTHEIRGNINETSREFTSPTAFSRNEGESRRTKYLSTLHFDTPGLAQGKHRLTGLVERENQEFTPVTQDNITREREIESYAADYFGEFFGIATLQASARRDDFETFGRFDTWRSAASLDLPNTPVRLHASAGTGVKAPTMFEQFGELPAFFVPNPDLVPEESFGWDAGAELTLRGGRASIDVTWFEADLENRIASDPDAVFLVDPNLINLDGTSEQKGVEVAGRMQLTDSLDIGGAYTYLAAVDAEGFDEIRQPRHAGRVDVGYRFAGGRGKLNTALIFNGEMDDLPFNQITFDRVRVTLDDYMLVNVAGSYELRRGVELYGRVENLLDEEYEEVFGYGTAGVAAYAGVRVTLGGEEGAIR